MTATFPCAGTFLCTPYSIGAPYRDTRPGIRYRNAFHCVMIFEKKCGNTKKMSNFAV